MNEGRDQCEGMEYTHDMCWKVLRCVYTEGYYNYSFETENEKFWINWVRDDDRFIFGISTGEWDKVVKFNGLPENTVYEEWENEALHVRASNFQEDTEILEKIVDLSQVWIDNWEIRPGRSDSV